MVPKHGSEAGISSGHRWKIAYSRPRPPPLARRNHTAATLSNPLLLTSMLSHPLSYTPSLCRRIPMMFRTTVRASLAALAVFNFACSLASPVTVSSTWHSMQKGAEPLCNSPTLHGPLPAPQCLWAGLGSRTRRPQPPLLPSLPRAMRPRSAPSVSIYPVLRKSPPSARGSPLPPRSAPSSSYNIQPSPSEPPPPRLPTPLHRSPSPLPLLRPSSLVLYSVAPHTNVPLAHDSVLAPL